MGLSSWLRSLFERRSDMSNASQWREWHQKNSGLKPIDRSIYRYDAPVLAALDNNPGLTLLSAVLHEKFPHPEPLVREKAIVEVAACLRDESRRAKLARRLAAVNWRGKSRREISALLPETLEQLLVLAQNEDSSERNQRLAASFLEKPLSPEARRQVFPPGEAVKRWQPEAKVVGFREPPRE